MGRPAPALCHSSCCRKPASPRHPGSARPSACLVTCPRRFSATSNLPSASKGGERDTPGPASTGEGEDTVLKIECKYRFRQGETSLLGPAATQDEDLKNAPEEGTYHYRLYLPPGYNANPAAKYPVMFIASPNGSASVGNFQERARRDRWLVVALIESKNSSPLWLGNFLGAHDDVIARARVIDDMKFCTGMSGGLPMRQHLPGVPPGLSGIDPPSGGVQLRQIGIPLRQCEEEP